MAGMALLHKVMWLQRTRTIAFFVLALLVAVLIGVLLEAKPAHATTYTVNSTDDDTDQSPGNGVCDTEPFPVGTEPKCTLRAAIQDANATAEADTITVPAGTYTLTIPLAFTTMDDANGDLDIVGALTINGAGARSTIVRGGVLFNDRIFENAPGTSATITGLTITGGRTGSGGGVYNQGALLTLDKVAVKGNTAAGLAGGGGVFSQNNGGTTLNIIDSTVSGNSTIGLGGGVRLQGGTANITNSTISNNHADKGASGVLAAPAFDVGATMNIRSSTIANNTAKEPGSGIRTASGAVINVRNSVVYKNLTFNFPSNCDTATSGGTITSQGNNISDDASCPFAQPTDKPNTNPLLGVLSDNGGPTQTHALLPGSPAVDAANNATCPSRDQRGVARKDGDRNGTVVCDIGAFERNDLVPPRVTATSPVAGATGAGRAANLTAVFSEKMNLATLNRSTFRLYKVNANGTTTQITNTTVTPSPDGTRATLNPYGTSTGLLAANTKYRAEVTPGAKDRAGNRLDQNSTTTGNQPKAWVFTTGST